MLLLVDPPMQVLREAMSLHSSINYNSQMLVNICFTCARNAQD